jgi:hypothetical protein
VAYNPYSFARAIKESSYGTAKTSPTAGVDTADIRLAGANRLTLNPVITQRKIAFGGGWAAEGYRKSDQEVVTGPLEMELCYSQAKLFLDAGITRINPGQTLPWVTTEPAGDLASLTFYRGEMRNDQSVKRTRYRGVKVHGGKLSSSADSGLVMLKLDLQAQKYDGNIRESTSDPDITAFPAPADNAFPTDAALYSDSAGTISVGGSPLAYVTSFDFSWTNVMDPLFFNSPFITSDPLRGRSATLTLGALYTATPNWRSLYQALTTEAVTFSFTNGTSTIAITMNGQNTIDSVSDDFAPGKQYMQSLVIANRYDPSVSQGIGFTFTP